MTIRTFLALWALFLGAQLIAQTNITGRVVEAGNREPLIGALILLSDGNGAVTDEKGRFDLTVPEGQQEISIRYLGYQDKTVAIDPGRSDLGDVALTLSSTTLGEVIVSASPQNYSSKFKGSNYRISPLALQQLNPLSTEEVLRTIPGLNIVGDMGLSNRPNISIRGSWGRRSKKVLLMEDGSPSAPAPYIAPGAYYNPVSDRITSIEVYKGADMLRFGPNNMYGAVNYITALPPQRPELRIKLIGGQRNYTTGLLSYGGTWNRLGALVEGVYKTFDGFTENSSVEILNLNAKIFAKLSENQSLYFKVSGQFEDNQASLSSQTPFTFETEPTANPLDADQFTMRRYGVDIIHKWLPKPNLSFSTKVYASDFERDWWRQVTAKVKASEVQSYVGDQTFQDRYSYLQQATFGPEDYVIVGKVNEAGRESTTDSRWFFTVSGIQETAQLDWGEHHLEAGFKLHQESYKDRALLADSSRWARYGRTTTDLQYHLWSASGYVRNEFNFGLWSVTPIARFEHIDMYRQDLLALSQDPNLSGTSEGRQRNVYDVFLPGLTVDYRIPAGEVFGSIYRGFIAPSKVFGFLVEQDGIVTNPFAGQEINIKPEFSLNTELGWRGGLFGEVLDGQLTYFDNTIHNFYAGGRNEVFEELGRIRIQGLELAVAASPFRRRDSEWRAYANLTLLHSQVLAGRLNDKDLFSQVIHNAATRQEYADKVNARRQAYEIYVTDGSGNEVLFEEESLQAGDLAKITKSLVRFGEDGVDNARAPYTPKLNLTAGMTFDYRRLSVGCSGSYVGKQFTEFNNFVHESADGSIGRLPDYFSLDAFANYRMELGKKVRLTAFVNGKNLTGQIYRASRLNRATSGIFPGGFRQIILGLNLQL